MLKPAVCESMLLAAVELEDVLLSKSGKSGFIYGPAAQQLVKDQLCKVLRQLADVKRLNVLGDAACCYGQKRLWCVFSAASGRSLAAQMG